MSVTAIIVNYHTAQLIPPLIQDLKQDPDVSQIIVVDNSNDFQENINGDPAKRIAVLHNEVNKGFGAAVNQAITIAGGEWILAINPDIRIEKNCIRRLIDAARHYGTSLAGPRFFWDDRHIFRIPPASGACFWQDIATLSSQQYALDAHLLSFYWILRHERFWEAAEPFVEPFLSGACLLIEKQWIDAGGGKLFDERFFLYYEDTDLCVRALQEGIRPLCVPAASVTHYYDQSPSPDKSKASYMGASHRLFREKHYMSGTQPAIETGRITPDIDDMGGLSSPPVFRYTPTGYDERRYVEIGVNPYFLPFAQAEIDVSDFRFPGDVWSRMAPGRYFGRVRGKISGIQKVVQWEKLP